MQHYGFLSLLPALVSIFLAITTAQVVPSLCVGIFIAYFILADFDFLQALLQSLDALVKIFAEGWVVKTILFSFLVGSLLILTQVAGGVQGFVDFLTKKHQLIKNKRAALLLAYCIGIVVFIESSITILLSGAITRPISDKFLVSREKLSYVCDSTSAPVCGLIPLNAWGATIMGAIATQATLGVGNPVELLIRSLPYQLYSWLTLLFVLWIILSGKDFGLMKKAELRAQKERKLSADDEEPMLEEAIETPVKKVVKPKISYILIPFFTMMFMMPFSLWVTGKGDMMQGSGSTAVFWSVLAAIVVAGVYYILVARIMKLSEFMNYTYKGVGAIVPVASILLFAFTIGNAMGQLETGKYLASLLQAHLPAAALPAVVFIASSIMALSTGTSFGTFSIMIPIALQMAVPMGAHFPLVIGAVVSGGIFGDHCSPISDTTIMASMVTGADHIHHVRTQIPYALCTAAAAVLLFLLVGFL